jgi:hypothetical protein
MDFSVIQQSPQVRALVQQNVLQREFKDALYPRNLFRGEAEPVEWPANIGDSMVFTGRGLMKPSMKPLRPGDEPKAKSVEYEQWSAQLHQWVGRAPDISTVTDLVAIARLFVSNMQALGLDAGMSLNRIVRDRLYNAALSGQTVATVTATSGHTITVARLNGFTTARRPDLSTGSAVVFDTVSSNNPLIAYTKHTSGAVFPLTITGFTPTYSGDETGPGTLTVAETLSGSNVTARDPIWTSDASFINRAGAGLSVDSVTGASHGFTYDLFRSSQGHMADNNVPKMPDGYYHAHLNNYSKGQLFSSDESQRLLTSLPDYYWYKEFTLGEVLGCLVFEDTETPQYSNVQGGASNVYDGSDTGEAFGGELYNATSDAIQRPIFIGAEAVYEYFRPLGGLVTEAGVNGEVGEFTNLTNNGIEVNVDRVQVYLRAPVNVTGDIVTSVWKAVMDWPCRTDALTGDSARFKRTVCVEHI